MTQTDRDIMAYHIKPASDSLVPADLPSNIPDVDKYPFARFGGLKAFAQLLSPSDSWQFIVNIGGRRDETPGGAFWDKSFSTQTMLNAYFRLTSIHRVYFSQHVVWIRDPLPGRPGGTQIPPPEWPGNLPTPMHHIMTRYAGLAEWVRSLPDQWAEVARMSLFGIHERFDDIWWADYHKTVDMYGLFTRLNAQHRNSFEEGVYWIPDGPAPRADDSSDDKPAGAFCYLALFRSNHRDDMRAKLGENPWAPAVASALLADPGIRQPGTYSFSILGRRNVEGSSYLQAHVEPSPDGMTINQLVPYLAGAMRVGATSDINALANLQLQDHVSTKPTLFPNRPVGGGPGLEMVYSVYAELNKANGGLNFTPMDHKVFTWLLGAFESVRVEDASFNISVSTGAQNGVLCAICGPGLDLNVVSDWYAAPVNSDVHGSDQGWVTSVFALPSAHSFDPEVRSTDSVGNPSPSFRFSFYGATGGKAMIKGMIKVRVAGQAVLGHIDIGPKAPVKSANRTREAIVDSLSYDVGAITKCAPFGDDEDDDDESDDEPTSGPSAPAGVRGSPQQANIGVSRS